MLDAIIIGGGHNGLTCAFYLARAGMNVTVCEARHVVGGAAVTEEFAPSFRNSTASYTVSLLQPKVIAVAPSTVVTANCRHNLNSWRMPLLSTTMPTLQWKRYSPLT